MPRLMFAGHVARLATSLTNVVPKPRKRRPTFLIWMKKPRVHLMNTTIMKTSTLIMTQMQANQEEIVPALKLFVLVIIHSNPFEYFQIIRKKLLSMLSNT
ncbi:hypothetical protein H5410_057499 [Solanum commersonii]|uniref:Uncharacterized protein n=1 Tax=Solanum commersonii TaxID=4109 RepID=A0A9J5WPW9_SOLCO|nr:hypothetical protein H5410_057499 [Solanum commersonii]